MLSERRQANEDNRVIIEFPPGLSYLSGRIKISGNHWTLRGANVRALTPEDKLFEIGPGEDHLLMAEKIDLTPFGRVYSEKEAQILFCFGVGLATGICGIAWLMSRALQRLK